MTLTNFVNSVSKSKNIGLFNWFTTKKHFILITQTSCAISWLRNKKFVFILDIVPVVCCTWHNKFLILFSHIFFKFLLNSIDCFVTWREKIFDVAVSLNRIDDQKFYFILNKLKFNECENKIKVNNNRVIFLEKNHQRSGWAKI